MREGRKEIKIRPGMSPIKTATVKDSAGTEHKFKLRVIGNDQFFELQGKMSKTANDEKMNEQEVQALKLAWKSVLLDNIIECPDGQPPDEEFIKWLDPYVVLKLMEEIVPEGLEKLGEEGNL